MFDMKVCDTSDSESLISNEFIKNPFVFSCLSKKIILCKMSDTKICNIIKYLAFTDNDKTKLRTYFYNNPSEIDRTVNFLDTCETADEKVDFIKETFLKTSMF